MNRFESVFIWVGGWFGGSFLAILRGQSQFYFQGHSWWYSVVWVFFFQPLPHLIASHCPLEHPPLLFVLAVSGIKPRTSHMQSSIVKLHAQISGPKILKEKELLLVTYYFLRLIHPEHAASTDLIS